MSTKDSRVRVRLSPEQRATEILRAAVKIARDEGLGALSVRSVATGAGIAAGLVTHYFSLDELVAKTYATIASEEYAETANALAALSNPVEKLDTVLGASPEAEYAASAFVWVESWAVARRNPQLRIELREQSERWHRLLSDLIEQGMRAGDFMVDDPSEAAWQLLALIDGTNAHAAMREIDDPLTAHILRRSAAAMLGQARPAEGLGDHH